MNRLTQRLETWAWVCLYGGLLLGSWSLFVSASAGYALWAMRGIAVAGIVAGVAMIYWRSRIGRS